MNTKSTISRRDFLAQTVMTSAVCGVFGLMSCTIADKEIEPKEEVSYNSIRVIAYNILKCTGWPPENVPETAHIPTLIARELAKYNPDIINFSEAPEEDIVKQIAEKLDMNYVYFSGGGYWYPWSKEADLTPGAILTRYEITDSRHIPIVSGDRPEDLFSRHWGSATIKLRNGRSLVVHSVHLYPHDTPESAAIRKREISEVLKSVDRDMTENKQIIVMGDLNHTPDMPEYRQWTDAGFLDTQVVAGENNGNTVMPNTPTLRIDYILCRGFKESEITTAKSLYEGAFRTYTSIQNSFSLSDHLPYFAQVTVR